MKKHIKGAILVSLAASLWGLDGILLTPRLYSLKVPFVVFILHLLPFLGMLLLFGKTELKNTSKLSFKDLFIFFLIALFGGSLGTLSIVKALFLVNFQHLTVVTLLQKLQPLFAIILAHLLLKEKLTKNFLIWGSVALVGGYLLTFQLSFPTFKVGNNILLASFYSLLAAFSFGSATVFGKMGLRNTNFRTALFIRYGFTSIIMFFICIFTNSLNQIFTVSKEAWIIIIIIGLTTGSGAIMLYYLGLKDIKARVATICELAFPISTIFFDYIFNGKLLTPIQCLGALAMLVSIFNITRKN